MAFCRLNGLSPMLFETNLNTSLHVERGHLLLSEPFLPDAHFERAVVLVCEHQEDQGTFGLILNKPTTLHVHEASEFTAITNQLFVGGPVEQASLHFIHRFSHLPEAIPLKNGLYWGGDFEQLQSMAQMGKVDDANCRFFIGYSGWSAGQLKAELEQNSWIIARTDLSDLLDVLPEHMWSSILKKMGGKYKAYANFPEDPRLN